MSDASHDEPVAAESFGDATQVRGTILEPSSWLLELGVAARTAELRAELQQGQGHPIRAWSSRRAGARARRERVRQMIAGAAVVGLQSPEAEAPGAVRLPEPVEPAGWDDPMELELLSFAPTGWPQPEPEPVRVVALPPVRSADLEPDADEALSDIPASTLLARIGSYTGAAPSPGLMAR